MTPRAQREATDLLEQAARSHEAGEAEQALVLCDRALALAPGWPPALAARGSALFALGHMAEALTMLTAAVAGNPGDSQAWSLIGFIHVAEDRVAEALSAYAAALDADPGNLVAALNMGLAMFRHGPIPGAVEAFRHVRGLDPRHAQAWHLEGMALTRLGAFADAVPALERATALDPDNVDSAVALGFALSNVDRWPDAIAAFDRALVMAPWREDARSLRLQARRTLADWDGYADEVAAIRAGLEQGGTASPFVLLSTLDDPVLQRRAAETQAASYPPATPLPAWPRGPADTRLRIAYVSADYFDHATLYLMLAMLEQHDRTRFEITAVNIGREVDDPWARRLRAAVEHYVPAGDAGDEDIVDEMRRRQFDVAVDLKGYTRYSRPAVFSQRAAPVQANWLGHPGTLGIAAMDYIIADRHIITADNRAGFREAVVTLPHCYQPNDPARAVAPVPFRAALGLPDGGVIYAAFNQVAKLTPDVFAVWMRILRHVPDGHLWLWVNSAAARTRLAGHAKAAGIDPARLIFAAQLPVDQHLARLTHADLFLDTLPYNAHTTASDALGRGVPVLTCTGRSFAARVATSLVRTVGLDDMAVADWDAYEALAVALGRDPARLAAVRARLAAALPTAPPPAAALNPLFDAGGFARGLEAAFTTMVARSRAGMPPADFVV